ncbi:methyl-accepting chemotaxis protein [Paraburkholderia sp. J63]|uniref:methyl-accepting chemotaxis protein n=1 Tax=Paraburkholderia sp. J63 TaxID=2805434 RepID=UPI002ABDCB93|nr:methyl-accepting chemotaxis protein [Paraburkholderia sp. J63]
MIRFRSFKGHVRRLFALLDTSYPGDFSLDASRQIELGGRMTPALMSGLRLVTLDHRPMDDWGARTGRGIASILVLAEGDLVRVATNITNAKGERGVGGLLDRSHPSYAATMAGQSFYGHTVVSGRKYIAVYRPIFDGRDVLIGAFAVGVDVDHIRMATLSEKLGLSIAGGASLLLLARDFLLSTLSGTPWLGPVACLSSLGVGAVLGTVSYTLGEMLVTRSLRQAADAAHRIASGDLSKQLAVTRGDEVGGMFDAQNGISTGLASLVGRVREATGSLSVAARQIASGNNDLSARTEAQAGSLEQTAAAVDELTSTVRNNADNAHEAHEFVQSTAQLAGDGAQLMERTVRTMQEIREASRHMSAIVGTIEAIAFQTNILALNAAVEAARAGAEGRGFAVVAQEVRVLAQRSATAAGEIKVLIGRAVGRIDDGGELVDHAGKNMEQILSSIRSVAGLMAEISQASAEQSTGIAEVNRAVSHMDEMTQQNAALVEQIAAAATSMHQQTDALERAVHAFRLT